MAPRGKLPVVGSLTDPGERKITYLRLSVTDRCNYRCTYCMPEEGVDLVPRQEILNFEELERLIAVFASLGVRRLRLTGGEPTIRQRIVELVGRLAAVPGIDELLMTSNGHRFPELARPLAEAGLTGVNISIDTLDPVRFRLLTRRGDLERVIAGIDAAIAAGLVVHLNSVALRGANEDDVAALCEFAWERGAVPRFIEHMPMSEGALYAPGTQLGAAEIRDRVAAGLGVELVAEGHRPGAGPSRYWRVAGTDRVLGIISAMTEHFCDTCNRVRLSASGELHTCLAYDDATDLRGLLRGGATDDDICRAIRASVAQKRDGHVFELTGQGGPRKHMISIGG